MKPVDQSHALILRNSGRLLPNQAAAAIRELRGDTIAQSEPKHPRVILSECKPIARRKR